MNADRAGIFMAQGSGFRSFKPKKLPPDPPVHMDDEMVKILSDADRKLGRLDGVTQVLPNPALFIAMYIKKEALLSAQIEGTQASLIEVLSPEESEIRNENVRDVVNYVNAVYYGLERVAELPMSLRLIREIHAVLLGSGRGSQLSPGEFRTTQNWIGPIGSTPSTASFVPPTVPDMLEALGDLEKFLHEEDNIPALIKIALIHAQFETIHPFLDGNGRMGRLLITFWLCQRSILSQPLLYISYHFKKNRSEYYDRLTAVRTRGDWEGWVKFFLKGVAEVSDESTNSARAILDLKSQCEKRLMGQADKYHRPLLDLLFESPVITRTLVKQRLNISHVKASEIVEEFARWGILEDMDADRIRGKRYKFSEYLNILERGTEL